MPSSSSRMSASIKFRIVAARNLPVMDKTTESTDAFAEGKLVNATFKTDTIRHSVNPRWNTDWIKHEINEKEFQEETLEIRVMHRDTYTSDVSIGRVCIDLCNLYTKQVNKTIDAWFPIFEISSGLRGEMNLVIQVEILSGINRLRQSSLGVNFFFSSCVPEGYRIGALIGFVSGTVVNDSTESQWMNKIRRSKTTSYSNRLRIFNKLKGELLQQIGSKLSEMGANAILGYRCSFDMSGDLGVLLRGYGTAVVLINKKIPCKSSTPSPSSKIFNLATPLDNADSNSLLGSQSSEVETPITKASYKLKKSSSPSSDNSLLKPTQVQKCDEFPFMTLSTLPPGYIKHFGSIVAAKSVKLWETSNDIYTLAGWWKELRTEIRSHMRSIACTHVIGYSEETIRCDDDIMILSANGTAVVLNASLMQPSPQPDNQSESNKHLDSVPASPNPLHRVPSTPTSFHTTSMKSKRLEEGSPKLSRRREKSMCSKSPSQLLSVDIALANNSVRNGTGTGPSTPVIPLANPCTLCHLPVNMPPPPSISRNTPVRCAVCRQALVPRVLLATTDPPSRLPVVGDPAFIYAVVSRPKRESKGESCAKEISDALPFIEHDLHKIMVQKLKVNGMNAAFGFKIQLSFGPDIIVAMMTATGIHVAPLPYPSLPTVILEDTQQNQEMQQIQKELSIIAERSRRHYNNIPSSSAESGIFCPSVMPDSGFSRQSSLYSVFERFSHQNSTMPASGLNPTQEFHGDEDENQENSFNFSDQSLVDPSCWTAPSVSNATPPQQSASFTVMNEVNGGINQRRLSFDEVETVTIFSLVQDLPPTGLSQVSFTCVPPLTGSTKPLPNHLKGFKECSSSSPSPTLSYSATSTIQPQNGSNQSFSIQTFTRISRFPLNQSATISAESSSLLTESLLDTSLSASILNASSTITSATNAMGTSERINQLLREVHRSTIFMLRKRLPAVHAGLHCRITVIENEIQFLLTGASICPEPSKILTSSVSTSPSALREKENLENLAFFGADTLNPNNPQESVSTNFTENQQIFSSSQPYSILSPLSSVPDGMLIDEYMGCINVFFLRETSSLREMGGISSFIQSCLSEAQLFLAGMSAALAGLPWQSFMSNNASTTGPGFSAPSITTPYSTALLAFHLSQPPILESIGRNQALCFLHLAGDRVQLTSQSSTSNQAECHFSSPVPCYSQSMSASFPSSNPAAISTSVSNSLLTIN